MKYLTAVSWQFGAVFVHKVQRNRGDDSLPLCISCVQLTRQLLTIYELCPPRTVPVHAHHNTVRGTVGARTQHFDSNGHNKSPHLLLQYSAFAATKKMHYHNGKLLSVTWGSPRSHMPPKSLSNKSPAPVFTSSFHGGLLFFLTGRRPSTMIFQSG